MGGARVRPTSSADSAGSRVPWRGMDSSLFQMFSVKLASVPRPRGWRVEKLSAGVERTRWEKDQDEGKTKEGHPAGMALFRSIYSLTGRRLWKNALICPTCCG